MGIINESPEKKKRRALIETVMATSNKLYRKNITWHSDTKVTSISEVNKIPKID
ncbi:MAG: hypothetical protein ACOX47_13420 [Bacillota bacterium]